MLLALLTALLAILLAAQSTDGDRQVAAIVHDSSPYKGAERPKIPTKDFKLSDQDGRQVTLKKYRGRIVVLTFMYTRCEDTCPVQAQIIVGALDDIGQLGKRVTALAISVNPENDTPARARSFLLEHRARGRIKFLLGSRVSLRRVWDEYGIQPQGKGYEHSASIVLIDSKGRQRIGHSANATSPERLAHDIRMLVKER